MLHSTAPVNANQPCGQCSHIPEYTFSKRPAMHAAHAVCALFASYPSAHALHAVDPADAATKSRGHATQSSTDAPAELEPTIPNVPAGHSSTCVDGVALGLCDGLLDGEALGLVIGKADGLVVGSAAVVVPQSQPVQS